MDIKWLYLDREREFMDRMDKLNRQSTLHEEVATQICNKTDFINGQAVKDFEKNLEMFDTQGYYAVACANGSDAMVLGLMASRLSSGHPISTTPYTFISTVESIVRAGYKPELHDIQDIERLTLPYNIGYNSLRVSIFSHGAGTCDEYLMEDGAQSFGAACRTSARFKTYSFHPTKNLGCYGDGGAIMCKYKEDADRIKLIRNHGMDEDKKYYYKYKGLNSRLDTIQAVILNHKLRHFRDIEVKRGRVASKLHTLIGGRYKTNFGPSKNHHQFIVTCESEVERKGLEVILKSHGIPTCRFYPVPIHMQDSYKDLGYSEGDFPNAELACKLNLALPISPFLTDEEICYIGNTCSNYALFNYKGEL